MTSTSRRTRAATVRIADWSLWTRHVRGDPNLSRALESLPPGETIRLIIGGQDGVWEKKALGSDGRSTPGLKPLGPMREIWFDWFKSRRGELVDIAFAAAGVAHLADGSQAEYRSDAETSSSAAPDRDTAWTAFSQLRRAGWVFRKDAATSRESLHERDGA